MNSFISTAEIGRLCDTDIFQLSLDGLFLDGRGMIGSEELTLLVIQPNALEEYEEAKRLSRETGNRPFVALAALIFFFIGAFAGFAYDYDLRNPPVPRSC